MVAGCGGSSTGGAPIGQSAPTSTTNTVTELSLLAAARQLPSDGSKAATVTVLAENSSST